MIGVVIAKPTKECNADCSYCSSPPDMKNGWSLDDFKVIFDRLYPRLRPDATIIWHGGEPMLQGVEFYIQAYEYAKSKVPEIQFSIQSNLLLYTKKWKSVFQNVFKGQISTSFDPDEENRTIKGNTASYSRQFFKKLDLVLADGFRPLVIGTYTEKTSALAFKLYDKSKKMQEEKGYCFSLRYNYRYPAGRAFGEGEIIRPETYGKMLIDVYDKWIRDLPEFIITPLDHMFLKTIKDNYSVCPWTKNCGGNFLTIEPNGDAYNCGEFADLKEEKFLFGNLKEGWASSDKDIVNLKTYEKNGVFIIDSIMESYPAKLMKRRRIDLPMDCKSCRHFRECEGGCMRDSELYGRGLGGKFYYCQSWKMVLDRIKQSILNGEADGVLLKMGYNLKTVKSFVSDNAESNVGIEEYLENEFNYLY